MYRAPSRSRSGLLLSVAFLLGACALTLAACGGGTQAHANKPPSIQPLSAEAALGAKAFHEPLLSASGRQSCASCHDASSGGSAPNPLAVQLGGAMLDVPGLRTSQSLRYLATNGPFHFDDDGTPTGGFFWDGRADSLALQAAIPLLGPREMANRDRASVVAKLARTAWAGDFRAFYGSDIFNDSDRAFDKLTEALQRFQLEDGQFNSFTSKYDAVLRGQTTLTPQELRGLALFNDQAKGNCAACHPSGLDPQGRHPLFTDFSFDNLGVPRNPAIPANRDPAYFDRGLCGRAGLQDRQDLCGAFKVPSLRNVALRQTYFHNGGFTSLRDVVSFYVTRDTDPGRWYPRKPDGSVDRFDDLPPQWRANVNTTEAPYNRKPGDTPALNDAEIDELVGFLKTLNDGWSPR